MKCDVCVIGAGAAGLSVAAGVAQLGLDTVLVERGEMGGDCLNRGCVPSKALLKSADIAHGARVSKNYGINLNALDIDFPAVKNHLRGVIDTIAPHDSQERFEKLGVKVLRESARFIDAYHLQVGDQTVKARYFVVATGSRPKVPEIPGLNQISYYTNETIFELKDKPDHLAIIGGGPIGVEMAQAHARLGSKVSLIDTGRILSKDDPDLTSSLFNILKDEHIDIYEQVIPSRVKKDADKVHVTLNDASGKAIEIDASHLLVAAGRAPNIENLNLDKAGVGFDEQGIQTNARLRTNKRHILALGDVIKGPNFTHAGAYQAGIIIRQIAFKMLWSRADYTALPWVTYTDPELATVGMGAAEAHEKYGAQGVKVVTADLKDNDRAQTERQIEGHIKVICRSNGRILGATILSPHAGELIGVWGLSIQKKLKMSDIAGMVLPYPTYSELSKAAASAFYKDKLFSDKTRKIVRFLQKLPV